MTSSSSSSSSEAPLRSSSSPPPPLPQSLRSPQLQAEFQRERLKFLSRGDAGESSGASSPPPSPFSPTPPSSPPSSSSSSSSPCFQKRQDRLSLSSPELLSELKHSRTRSLRHVPAHHGMTTVFSGRGRAGGVGGQESGSASIKRPANRKT